jgi:hypothetical protein
MLLIGSRATNFWHPEYKIDSPDWDVLADHETVSFMLGKEVDPNAPSWNAGSIEFHNVDYLNNREIVERYSTDARQVVHTPNFSFGVYVCSSRGLAAIKRAHLHRPIKFMGHMKQYSFLDKDFDCKDFAFIQKRKGLTLTEFGDVAQSKDVLNEEFFMDGVHRIIPHDELHKIVAEGNEPIYLSLKRDKNRAGYDYYLWHAASHETKLRAIEEEACVIAVERWLLPFLQKDKKYPALHACVRALEKCCTTLDNGPFREYTIDNWNELLQRFDGEKLCSITNYANGLTNTPAN